MAQQQRFQQQQQMQQVQLASAVQVLLSKLLEMPLADFEERVRNELLDNEAIETQMVEGGDDYELGTEEGYTSSALDDAAGDYASIDDMPETLREAMNNRNDDEGRPLQIADTVNESDELYRQVSELQLNEEGERIMRYLIGSLDDNGFLPKSAERLADELAFKEYIYIDTEELRKYIHLLQGFEPRGIGAKNLQECLLLQLPDSNTLARRAVQEYFEEIMQSGWGRIAQRLRISPEEVAQLRHDIAQLNPRPGSALEADNRVAAPTIVADFRVECSPEGVVSVRQLRGDVPTLRVSPAFVETLSMHHAAQERATQQGQRTKLNRQQEEAIIYARQKVDAAQAFIEGVRRRYETLQHVMESIIAIQHDFFLNDDDESFLRPMVLKDVAERAGVDISTVSRAANSKYVETDYGTYPLRFFFSTQFTAADGETLAARQVKAAIERIVATEDRRQPLSDEAIAAALEAEGTKIARRTVSKYREQLGIAKARMRVEA